PTINQAGDAYPEAFAVRASFPKCSPTRVDAAARRVLNAQWRVLHNTAGRMRSKLRPIRTSESMNKHFHFSGSTFRRLEELGVSASAVLRRAGLAQGYVDQARVLLKTEELFAFWRAVGEVSTNPAIGLLLGT